MDSLIWVMFGDPQKTLDRYHSIWLPVFEKSYGKYLPQEYVNYLDNQILEIMRQTARDAQESMREVAKKEKLMHAVDKVVEGAEKATLAAAALGIAIESGGTAIPLLAFAFGSAEAVCAASDTGEGVQDLVSAGTGKHVCTPSWNAVRDDLCGGNERTYQIVNSVVGLGCVVVTGASAVKSIREAYKAGKLAGEMPKLIEAEDGSKPKFRILTEKELEKVVGGAKDPSWRPGAKTAGKAVEQKIEAVTRDAKGLYHGEDGRFVTNEKVKAAEEAGKLLDKSGNTVARVAADGVSEASSTILSDNMIAAGIKRPSYPHAAHHIVAGNDPGAADARNILSKFNININAAENGVFLPTERGVSEAAYHPSLHTNEYYRKVNEILSGFDSKEGVLDALRSIAKKLLLGTF